MDVSKRITGNSRFVATILWSGGTGFMSWLSGEKMLGYAYSYSGLQVKVQQVMYHYADLFSGIMKIITEKHGGSQSLYLLFTNPHYEELKQTVIDRVMKKPVIPYYLEMTSRNDSIASTFLRAVASNTFNTATSAMSSVVPAALISSNFAQPLETLVVSMLISDANVTSTAVTQYTGEQATKSFVDMMLSYVQATINDVGRNPEYIVNHYKQHLRCRG